MVTLPAWNWPDTVSYGAPMARSAYPSWLISSAARDMPNSAPARDTSITPLVSRSQILFGAGGSTISGPLGPEKSTSTAPAAMTVPTDSPGSPAAMSQRASPLKSPAASDQPSQSPASGSPGTPGVPSFHTRPTVTVSPPLDPGSMLIAPS